MIKVATWGTDMIEALPLVIDGATQQINFVQPIDSMPPAAAVQPVQSMPAASRKYLYCLQLPETHSQGHGKVSRL
uniref:Uncharacterized protein n=1 Tax=Romanomermis culicivorax TaxID=13658 RepID=A0A915JAX7_ROMCU